MVVVVQLEVKDLLPMLAMTIHSPNVPGTQISLSC